MRALWMSALVLAACSSAKQTQICDVETLAGSDVAMQNYIPCGTFTQGDVNYTDDAMAAAQACVLNALSSNRPFELVYDAADSSGNVTGLLRVAFTGALPSMGTQTVVSHVYAGEGHQSNDMGMLNVSATTCMSITPTDGCTPTVGVPCLTCTPLGTGSLVCQH